MCVLAAGIVRSEEGRGQAALPVVWGHQRKKRHRQERLLGSHRTVVRQGEASQFLMGRGWPPLFRVL